MKLLYLLLVLSGCSLGWADQKKHAECDCFSFLVNGVVNDVCPGSTFQFEQRGWHGACDSRETDPSTGKCKCYNCNSCYILEEPDL